MSEDCSTWKIDEERSVYWEFMSLKFILVRWKIYDVSYFNFLPSFYFSLDEIINLHSFNDNVALSFAFIVSLLEALIALITCSSFSSYFLNYSKTQFWYSTFV
jgi:hypothetical protein